MTAPDVEAADDVLRDAELVTKALDLGLLAWRTTEAREHFIEAVAAVGRLRERAALASRVETLIEALNCEHNHQDSDAPASSLWDYVEHEGKTWNRCTACGLLELWEGGMFVCTAVSGPGRKDEK